MTKPKFNVSKPAKPSKASMCREGVLKEAIGPAALYEVLRPLTVNLTQEVAWSVSLDCACRVLSVDEIGRGAVDHVEVNPRELFRPAIENAASYVVLVHYHPSGDNTPSQGDIGLTRKMLSAGQVLTLPLADHMVITRDKFTTLSQIMPEFSMPELIPEWTVDEKTKADMKVVGERVKKDLQPCNCRVCRAMKGVGKLPKFDFMAALGDDYENSV
jgi:proteasome lid subunit RPN8/RPN11